MNEEGKDLSQEAKLAQLDKIIAAVKDEVFDHPARFDALMEFVAAFKKAHPEHEKYHLFHLLAGSSRREDRETIFDLPDHTLENFIRSLEQMERK
ncbi:MAG: hypothetical protein HY395_02070 [Candidatus Doudnabacteria bacterium]|nr:hypothetical protein [Candidatus Doudnabacteria bacterium]